MDNKELVFLVELRKVAESQLEFFRTLQRNVDRENEDHTDEINACMAVLKEAHINDVFRTILKAQACGALMEGLETSDDYLSLAACLYYLEKGEQNAYLEA